MNSSGMWVSLSIIIIIGSESDPRSCKESPEKNISIPVPFQRGFVAQL